MGDESPESAQSMDRQGNAGGLIEDAPGIIEIRAMLAAKDQELQLLQRQLARQQRPYTVSEVSGTEAPPTGSDDPFGVLFKSNQSAGEATADDLFAELADLEKTTEYGPPILQNIASGIKPTVTRLLSKETASTLSSKFKVPENCKELAVPRMNKEVWMHLPSKARVQDVQLQSMQQTVAQGLIGLTSIANIVGQHKDVLPEAVGKEILRCVMDTANLLGTGFQSFNQRRKNEVKVYIKPECASICDGAVPVTEFLFGDNLKDALQTSKAAAQVMRVPTHRERIRPRPYEKPARYPGSFQPHSLNRQGPPPPIRRGGWNNRSTTPKPYQQRGNRFQPYRH